MMSLGTVAGIVSPRRAFGEKHAGSEERAVLWEEYVRRIGHSEEFALSALMNETGFLVYAAVRRLLSFRQDAEDVVADVYVQVWRTATTYNAQRGSVRTWLTTIARSRALDRLRKCGQSRLEIELSEHISDNIANVESTVAAFEIKNHINQALQTLPFEHRRAIELAYFSGFTMSEIAEHLGHPLGTVKSRIRSGLTRLRLVLPSPYRKESGTRNVKRRSTAHSQANTPVECAEVLS